MAQRFSLEDLEGFTGISQEQYEEYIAVSRLKATKKKNTYEVADKDMRSLSDELLLAAKSYLEKGLGTYLNDRFSLERPADLYKAANCFGFAGDTVSQEAAGSLADATRFMKTSVVMSVESQRNWGRFAPIMTGEQEDGSTYASPDPRQVTESDVEAVMRYKELTTDLELQTVCADFAFVFKKKWSKGEKVTIFRFAVEGYLALTNMYFDRGKEWRHRLVDALARSLQIAEWTKQADLALKAKEAHLEAIQRLIDIEDYRYIIEIAESLHLQSNTLTDEERLTVLDSLAAAAASYARKEGENRHLERSFLMLKKEMSVGLQKESVSSEIVESYVKEAKERNAEGMVKLFLAEGALKELKIAGLEGGGLERDLKLMLSEGTKEAVASMKPISVEVKISNADVEQMVKDAIGEKPEDYLKILSISPMLVPSWEQAERHYSDGAEYSVVSRLFTTTLFSSEQKLVEVEGGLGANLEQITRAYVESIEFTSFLRVEVFSRVQKAGFETDAFIKQLQTSSIFLDYPHFNVIAAGIRQYHAGEHFIATTILSIQLEGLLRFICEKTRKPTIRGLNHNGNGGHEAIMFTALLSSLREDLGEDIYRYIHITCCDPYGMQIRNEAAHARLSYEGQRDHAQIVLHIFLLLSGYEYKDGAKNTAD